jgi:D-xylose 1-dehydrogenase (NADP+, D-xylono-1,5-lactone-forming)
MPAIDISSNGRIVALASRSPARARAMLGPYPEARVCDSYEDLIAQRDVDAVYIPLVNNLHKEWTLRALAARKHVLCEKPLAMNAAEAEEIETAAKRAERHVMEAFMYRFDPRVRDFAQGIRDPLFVQATFGFRLEQSENYRFDAALGGGALLDVGCYTASLARWIMGEPDTVLARGRIENGVDMTASLLLGFAGGGTATLWCSFESAEEQEVMAITPDQVHRLHRPFTAPERWDEPYRLMVESFSDSVLHDRPVAIPLQESIANMRVLDAARAAFSS